MYKLIFIFLLFTSILFAQNINVDDQYNPQNLVEDVLINNPNCASVSNVTAISGDFGTNEKSYGYFNGTGTNFPFQEGIVLSTGKAKNVTDAPSGFSDDDGNNWGTDADLETVLNTNNTYNATVLEFNFTPITNFVSFDYIFASEEYQEFSGNTCNFSDTFAFLIKPIGGTYTNIAVVPNTTIPVAVTTIHPEISGSCSAVNEQYFGSWINTNSATIMNGQTAVLTAKSDVIPNQTYHIKLVIADHQNYRYDSAVFLDAGSFNIGVDLGQDRLKATSNALCGNETLPLDAGIAQNYRWQKNGVDISGASNQTLTITPTLGDGIYSVISDFGFGCTATSEIKIEYDVIPILQNTTLYDCEWDNNQSEIFNLEASLPEITNNDSSLILEGFYLSLNDAQNNPLTTQIPNPTSYLNTQQNQVVFARIANTSGCVNFAEVTLTINQFSAIADDQEVYYCTNTYPNKITLQSGFLNGIDSDYNFLWNTGETTQSIQINEIGDYEVEITNANNCTSRRIITVLPSNLAEFNEVNIVDTRYPDRIDVQINVIGTGDYIYAIDIDPLNIDNEELYQEENVFERLLYGFHTIYIKDKNGCGTLTKEITLLSYPKFFTPNQDGIYDTWNLDNINTLETHFNVISNIVIYNRFGKIMSTISPYGLGWNGNYNGKLTSETTYWFTVDLQNFKGEKISKKGFFSLSR